MGVGWEGGEAVEGRVRGWGVVEEGMVRAIG